MGILTGSRTYYEPPFPLVTAWLFEVYNIDGLGEDYGTSLLKQERGCGALTGWEFYLGTATSSTPAYFYLPYFIKSGCVERAIVSAGGPKLSCKYQGTMADDRRRRLGKREPAMEVELAVMREASNDERTGGDERTGSDEQTGDDKRTGALEEKRDNRHSQPYFDDLYAKLYVYGVTDFRDDLHTSDMGPKCRQHSDAYQHPDIGLIDSVYDGNRV